MPAPSWWPVYASAAAFFALLGLVVNGALLVTGIALAVLSVLGWYVDSYRELKVAEGIAARPHERDPLALFPRTLATLGALAVLVGVSFAVGPDIMSSIVPAGAAGSASPSQCTPAEHPEISAKGIAFSTGTLCLPAGVPFKLVFHNEDQVQHNVAIGTLFSGEVFSGPGDRTYDVPALAAGQYKFICVVHPTVMFGTASVVAGGAPPGGGPQPIVSPSSSAGGLGSPGASPATTPGSGASAPPAGATAAPSP
jgi:plastocyanin